MRFLRAIVSVWLTLIGWTAFVLAILGMFACVGVVAHQFLGIPKEPLVPFCLFGTLLTGGALIVEWYAPRPRR